MPFGVGSGVGREMGVVRDATARDQRDVNHTAGGGADGSVGIWRQVAGLIYCCYTAAVVAAAGTAGRT